MGSVLIRPVAKGEQVAKHPGGMGIPAKPFVRAPTRIRPQAAGNSKDSERILQAEGLGRQEAQTLVGSHDFGLMDVTTRELDALGDR